MIKTIVLAGIIALASTAAMAAVSKPYKAPTAPQPQGFCIPAGNRC